LGNSRTAVVRSMPSWKTVHGTGASLPRPWFQTEMTVLPPSGVTAMLEKVSDSDAVRALTYASGPPRADNKQRNQSWSQSYTSASSR